MVLISLFSPTILIVIAPGGRIKILKMDLVGQHRAMAGLYGSLEQQLATKFEVDSQFQEQKTINIQDIEATVN